MLSQSGSPAPLLHLLRLLCPAWPQAALSTEQSLPASSKQQANDFTKDASLQAQVR
jgi:hypothetical protein